MKHLRPIFYLSIVMLVIFGPLHRVTQPVSLKIGAIVMNLRKRPWEPLIQDEGPMLHCPFATIGGQQQLAA